MKNSTYLLFLFLTVLVCTNAVSQTGKSIKNKKIINEMYARLRGSAEKIKVLATAFSDTTNKGTGRHEPMLMTIKFGKGRIFHIPMGHIDYSVECVGFITCLLRGAQWAATGKVDIPIPTDFPTEQAVSSRKFVEKE